MKKLVLLCFIIQSLAVSSQKLSYNFKSISGSQIKNAKLIVTPSSEPLRYQNTNVVIQKFDLLNGTDNLVSFFLYKFKGNLYILDGTSTKLNHTKDQILFSLPHQESYNINVPGFMEKSALVLLNFTTINGVSFYKYDVMSSSDDFKILELIFDKDLDISELKFSHNGSTGSFTKANITIRLRQR